MPWNIQKALEVDGRQKSGDFTEPFRLSTSICMKSRFASSAKFAQQNRRESKLELYLFPIRHALKSFVDEMFSINNFMFSPSICEARRKQFSARMSTQSEPIVGLSMGLGRLKS